ncbi:probable ATP-dependent RNA helicase DDX52 [Toxorhynchites rutilus septentrionalis]|uniref:probable ATP-dependent RNA helicase DDX52 n=1 Tax=Toxorhynchites rutilus septentrionalis TaxID=329112 RepID=UPI0024799AC9|nr:probable ATP-dependent RNA helicase DDX52 [Toxorhynchites rutilus septentrionalis]
MDTSDIFRKLTCGVKFSPKNNVLLKRKHEPHKKTDDSSTVVKLEIKEEDSSDEGGTQGQPLHEFTHSPLLLSEDEIKEEIKSEDGDDDDRASKKKRRLLTPEQLGRAKQMKVNRLRNIHQIKVKRSSVPIPDPIECFQRLAESHNVSNQLIKNIVGCGYKAPTPVQMQAIPVLLEGHPLHACAPTGSGKTAAFLIPIIHHLKKPMKCGFRALIVCPTRELAKQTQREALRLCEDINLRTHVITKVDETTTDYGLESKKHYDILVTTPNRICFLANRNPPLIDLSNIQYIVVDEADKLFEESKNGFREQLDSIMGACTNPCKVVAFFSATLTKDVSLWAGANMPNRVRFSVGAINSAVDLVEQELLFVGSESGKLLAIREMVHKGLTPPVLVFVQSKDRAQQLFTELIYDGLNVDVIHADRSQKERDNVVRSFREGKIWILICTELMSRGIDFKGVNLVVNYDFPPSTISYVHRIGRTGRAGRRGKAVTYFTKDDTTNLRSIAHLIKSAGGSVPEYMLKLRKSTTRERKKLEQKAPKRAAIRTLPAFEMQERAKRKKMIAKSKAKKQQQNGGGKSSVQMKKKSGKVQ